MKRFFALALLVMLLPLHALAEPLPVYTPGVAGDTVISYDTDTLRYDIVRFTLEGVTCYLTRVWMVDPGRQIRKATAVWEESLAYPSDMAATIDGAALAINGSGYVSPIFPWIPENYPGVSEDYHYTPLGSLTITDGEIFRNLEGVAYYGLTLQADGLHLHVGEDNDSVLAGNPTQTWSFYVECPLIQDGQDILDRSWAFANRKAIRTIIAKKDDNNYVLLTVTSKGGGLPVTSCVDFLLEKIAPEWAYNLDGGPSSALLYRMRQQPTIQVLYGNTSKDADAMVFTELPQEP
ncbi:MAG: phosphodiester glycosidase family protein [Aristaeellaceae bacterium]